MHHFQSVRTPNEEEPVLSTLRGGTMLHKGFYDLLALATPSRFFGGIAASRLAAGPRYEEIPARQPPKIVASLANIQTTPVPPPGAPSPLQKNKRISKDMVSNPTGFV